MSLTNELAKLGADIDDALQRFMGNEKLYIRMLGKLPKAVADAEVISHFESGNYDAALTNAHTLKGVMGNLSITPLYKAYSDAVALLRESKPNEAKIKIDEILPLQKDIIDCIEKYN